MFFARKRSDSNNVFCLCESAATATTCFVCAKAQRQQQRVLSVRKRSDSNSTDVGHEGVITGRDVLAFVPLLLIPKESRPLLQSTFIQRLRLNKYHSQLLVMSHYLS